MLLLPSQTAADSALSAGIEPNTFGMLATWALLGVAIVLLAGFAMAARVEAPRIESHWGGFGGSGGGWRMSTSMAYLLGALAFGAMFTALAQDLPRIRLSTPSTGVRVERTSRPDSTAAAQIPKSTSRDTTRAPPALAK